MSTPVTGPFAAPGRDAPVYVISVAAELTGLHPQTLRTYDRLGLVRPGRTGGGGRRYSSDDIEMLREVARLTAEGLGLEGVRRVLELEHQVFALQTRVAELREQLREASAAIAATAHPPVPNLPVPVSTTRQIVRWQRTR